LSEDLYADTARQDGYFLRVCDRDANFFGFQTTAAVVLLRQCWLKHRAAKKVSQIFLKFCLAASGFLK